jgi:uncharacterized protein YbjT (DUF2867 family)
VVGPGEPLRKPDDLFEARLPRSAGKCRRTLDHEGMIGRTGVFGNGRSTEPHFAWHEMIERYIEGSGVVWAHLHPNFFMENILTTLGLPNSQLRWTMGDKRVGWIAAEDLAGISATVLAGGPATHGGQNYFLSTDVLNGREAAAILSEILGRPIAPVVMTPSDLLAAFASGAAKAPPEVEETMRRVSSSGSNRPMMEGWITEQWQLPLCRICWAGRQSR